MIGIFDSGIGGLTVAKEIRTKLPDYQLVYFGDTARTPYGNKSDETVIQYALEDTRFLLDQGAQMIVIACNTASAVASEAVRQQYPDTPVFEVVTPAVDAAVEATQKRRIGVIGTRTTIGTDIYAQKIHAHDTAIQVISKPCPLFVPLAEEGLARDQITKMVARRYFQPLKQQQIDTLILGCTHYPILHDVIQQKIGSRVSLIDPATPTVASIKAFLENNADSDQEITRGTEHKYYFSDLPSHLPQLASRWLGETIDSQLHHIQ